MSASQTQAPDLSLLSGPLLDSFSVQFEQIANRLRELQTSQESLLKTINVESQKLETIPFLQNIVDSFSQIDIYHQKAVAVKKGITTTSDRVQKLKKRAEKLHLKRQAEEIAALEKRERELERERQLVAKPSPNLNPPQ